MTAPGSTASASDRRDARVRWTSEALFADADEVLIEHRGREYRLRITQSGKLILNA